MAMAVRSLLPSSRTGWVLLALVPLAAPAAYALYLNRTLSRQVTFSSGLRRRHSPKAAKGSGVSDSSTSPAAGDSASLIPADVRRPVSLPGDVASDSSDYVLAYDRVVSQPIPFSSLTQRFLSQLVTAYLRGTMVAFTRTPQAPIIKWAITAPEDRHTFDREWIENLQFAAGDLVTGVYRVAYRKGTVRPEGGAFETVELLIETPEGYSGPPAHGLIVVVVETVDEKVDANGKLFEEPHVRFINETWFWRSQEEKPVMLESAFGRWFHGLVAGWLVVKGIAAVTQQSQRSSMLDLFLW